MAGQQQQLREIFFLQVAIVCLVVVLAVLGVQTLSGRMAYPGFTFAAIGIATAAVGVVMWMSYRATKRTVAPVDWVLRQVAQWDPRRPDTHMLAPENVPAGVQGDARKLADAMHQLAVRLDAHVARERDFTRRQPRAAHATHRDPRRHRPDRPRRGPVRAFAALAAAHPGRGGFDGGADRSAAVAGPRPGRAAGNRGLPARDVIEREVERIRLLAEEKGLALEVALEAEPVLHGPPRILGVMLGNVLSNAVRFTGHGSVRLRLLADRIEVDDTGIGMDAASLARAFEPFYRVNIEQPEGPGLGLSIAHRLGERCGWPLQLASHPGEGTRATILLDGAR